MAARHALPLALIMTVVPAVARDAVAHPGQWSSLNARSHIQIHMALVRGDGSPFHSRIMTWDGRLSDGEEIGWQAVADGCGGTAWNSFTFDLGTWSPGANIFCGGHAQLAEGRGLLSAGGDDVVNERGIRDARTYQAGSGSQPGAWLARARMHHERFYPTVSALSDGRAIAVGGSRSPQLWVFGGRRDGSPPTDGTGDELHRLGRATDGIWEPATTPLPDLENGPPHPREGHTAVRLTQDLNAQVVYGGMNGNGNTVDNEVWLLTRSSGAMTAADFTYQWGKRPTTGLTMDPRCEHVALSNGANTEMVIYGGLKRPAGGLTTVTNEFRRLFKHPQLGWQWSNVTASGSGPGARYGHAAAYDASTRRMFLFGGSSFFGDDPTNSQVRVFTFDDASFASGTWSTLAVTGGPPEPRRDHTLVFDPGKPQPDPDVPALYLFGGYINETTSSSTLWKLDLSQTPAAWSPVEAGGDIPAPRAGHTAYYDNQVGGGRLFIFGGEPTSATELDDYVYTIDPLAPSPTWSRGALAGARLSGQTMGVDAEDPLGSPYARLPEIYTPGAGGSPGSWALQSGSGLQSSLPHLYPLQFVVPGTSIPGGGGRLIRVGPDHEARYLDVPSTGIAGAWQPVPNGSLGFFNPWSAVMYEPGRILVAGGRVSDAVGTTKTLDATGTAGWQDEPDLVPRFDHTLLMLPTGQVLATGGRTFLLGSQYCPQIWTPGQGWTAPSALACDDVKREYHSSALLLPDGRILTGGGFGGLQFPDSKKLRLYCPPYLFKNAQGDLAARPVIGEWPRSVAWGDTFTICTANPAAITKVSLMRPGAVTHSFDQNGRYVPLEILERRTSPAQLVLRAPASPDSAPPGDYMLFILGSADGPDVPSIAQWVNVGCASCDATAPAANTDLFIEIVTESSVYPLWVAKGDDGTVGSATRYDFRRSTEPITAGNFASAARVGMPPPLCPGSSEFQEVGGLAPCTQYYFALKTGDGVPNWSAMSNVEQATTIGTGVCGGGGFSARRVEGEEGAGAASNASAASVASPEAPGAALASSGVEGGPTVASAQGLGTAPLVVETRVEGEGAWRVTIRFGTEADGLDLSASSVLVDQAGAGGGRDLLGRIKPGASETRLGLCSLRERGRVAIRDVVALEQVAPRLRHRGQDYVLADARHSRLGSLGAGFLTDGGSPELLPGDVLDLTYGATGDARPSAPSWYLVVRREGTGTPRALSQRPVVDRSHPSRFVLHPGEPNPAASEVIIRFDLPQASPVRLEVFDLLGRQVATLVDRAYPAGNHAAGWDLRDTRGAPVRPGVYVCRLSAGNNIARSKLTVLP